MRIIADLCVFAFCFEFLPRALGHGRLIEPVTRKGDTGYEDDPAPSLTDPTFICKHDTSQVEALPVNAGSSLALKWRFGAAHVGDCAVYISYDTDLPLLDTRWFKIANLFDCRAQNNQDVNIELPSWLPPGSAILRWDWSALHTYPNVEFYNQCVDITITSMSSVSPSSINTYSIVDPPIYPSSGQAGVGFRNPFDPNSPQFVTGPACARGETKNSCELTNEGTAGSTGGGGEADSGGNGGGSGVDTGDDGSIDPDTLSPLCEIYTVESGDTLFSIASKYKKQGHPELSWQQICNYNELIDDCNYIDVGDTYIIPLKGTPCEYDAKPTLGRAGNGTIWIGAAIGAVVFCILSYAFQRFFGTTNRLSLLKSHMNRKKHKGFETKSTQMV